jgi:LysM repeat protein
MMTRLALLIVLIVTLIGISGVTAQDSTYTLQYGDVLDVIAASFDLSVNCLAEASGIDNPNKVRPGDTLIVDRSCPPYDGAIPIAREAADTGADDQGGGAASSSRASSGDGYTVERGDVLDLVAAAFDVDVNCLAEANDLAPRMLIFPGDVLTIDMSCSRYDGEAFVPQPREELELGQGGGGGSTYVVRVGDYLEKIAARFNVETACLGESNGLTNPGRIFPGDEITISTNCPPFENEL